jgi:hypothetical protein
MFNILNYKGNVNLSNIEIPFHLRQKGTIKKTNNSKY